MTLIMQRLSVTMLVNKNKVLIVLPTSVSVYHVETHILSLTPRGHRGGSGHRPPHSQGCGGI